MTPKQTALLNVTLFLLAASGAGLCIAAVAAFLTLAEISLLFSIGLLCFIVYMIYGIELAKAEALEQLNKK